MKELGQQEIVRRFREKALARGWSDEQFIAQLFRLAETLKKVREGESALESLRGQFPD